MFRATTPVHQFVFNEDPSEYARVLITYSQGGKVVLEKEKDDLEVLARGGKYRASYRLTQAESNKFVAGTDVSVQVRVLTTSGESLASEIKTLRVSDVLDDRVLS